MSTKTPKTGNSSDLTVGFGIRLVLGVAEVTDTVTDAGPVATGSSTTSTGTAAWPPMVPSAQVTVAGATEQGRCAAPHDADCTESS